MRTRPVPLWIAVVAGALCVVVTLAVLSPTVAMRLHAPVGSSLRAARSERDIVTRSWRDAVLERDAARQRVVGLERKVKRMTERRRGAVQRAYRAPLPAGVWHLAQRMCMLMNAGDFAATKALFSDGTGIDPRGLATKQRLHLRVRSIQVLAPVSGSIVFGVQPSRLQMAVQIEAPEQLFIAGGGGFPPIWTVVRDGSGHWRIESIATGN